MRRKASAALTAITAAAVLWPAAMARAALEITEFSLKPSTTQAGAHPSIVLSAGFVGADNNAAVKDIALHLPVGLRARPRAARSCTPARLSANTCPLASKVGSITVEGEAYGYRASLTREIFNMRRHGSEAVRLGGTVIAGFPIILPINARADGGLDISITGLPKQVGPVVVRLDRVVIRIKGTSRGRALLTNPETCTQANTVLEVTFHDPPTPRLTATSTFTPTGCPTT